ncbi:hypothetical protein GF406_09510 [candidate division KSB1 bacterium]|nr:hypothetical protein [candidate division KSB1 bacterium]
MLGRYGKSWCVPETGLGESLTMPISEPLHPVPLTMTGLVKRLLLLPRSMQLTHLVFSHGENAVHYIGEGESTGYLTELLGEYQSLEKISLPELLFKGYRYQNRIVLRPLIGKKTSDQRTDERRSDEPDAPVVLEVNRLLRRFIPARVPVTFSWIRQIAHLDDYRNRKSYINGVFGRKVRKYGFTHRVTQDSKELNLFYHNVYLPYIQSRFGRQSHPRSLKMLDTQVRHGFLLQVYEQQQCVAAAVCRRIRRQLIAVAFGVAQDHDDHLKRGALSACYYFIFQQAEREGLDSVDLLRSRPHKNDGVYEHKRRWGAHACRDPWPHTVLGILPSGILPAPLQGVLVHSQQGFTELSA